VDEVTPWADIIGPCYTSAGIQRVLSISRSQLSRASRGLQILRLPTDDGPFLYPAFQIADYALIPGLDQVLAILRTGIDDPWTWAQWLNTKLPDQPNHIEQLITGSIFTVLKDASRTAAAWAG
jgi:hypothetical protein